MTARTIDLELVGMTCAACAARIEKMPNRADGVHAAVNLATETAHVEFDAAAVNRAAIVAAIDGAGFDAQARQPSFARFARALSGVP